ncbi:MAG: FAD-dependent oxidoreductase [Caldithrix sp.]|nr:FAD-dependent oxidoreductase [Caldithrix sp.]
MPEKTQNTDILIIGGGTSGVCAAIQAARFEVQVTLAEPTPWLGGMLSAAGVCAIDGNHDLPSGLWGEFRDLIYEHYGGPQKVQTGWVSKTLFEPHIANQILKSMVAPYPNITVLHHHSFQQIIETGNVVQGAYLMDDDRNVMRIHAGITIDATEYGDVIAAAGCGYNLGRESRQQTGEAHALRKADNIVQDLTYVAILKDYRRNRSKHHQRPQGYDPELFRGCCQEWARPSDDRLVSAERMLEYGRLPNNKYMINWPNKGNDYNGNLLQKTARERELHLQEAKDHTKRFVYFMQNQLGFDQLDYANDEFPTEDRLALIPYIRESRRLKSVVQLTTNDIIDPYANPNRPIYRTGIGVGDYPIDHHHPESIKKTERYPSIPAFNVPYGVMIPQSVDGLISAEKNIGVTHIVNGCTRLQPVVMQIGQAAGAAAAMAVQEAKQPGRIAIRGLQKNLLNNGVRIMPISDMQPHSFGFESMQKMAVTGLLQGVGESTAWANRFYMYPGKPVTTGEFALHLKRLGKEEAATPLKKMDTDLSRALFLQTIGRIIAIPAKQPSEKEVLAYLRQQHLIPDSVVRSIVPEQIITRDTYAVLLDHVLHPFEKLAVDIKGGVQT